MRNRGNPRKTKRKHLFVVLMMIVLLDHYCVHHVCRRVESLSLRPLILGGVRCHQQEHQMQQWCPPTTTTNPRRCLFKVPTVAVGAVDCATTATMRFRPTPRWMGGTNNDSNNNNPGMEEAFRELEALTSLDDPEDYVPAPQRIAKPNDILRSSTSRSISTESDNNTDINSEGLLLQLDEYKPSSMEQDFAVYKSMAEEIEQDEQAIAYAEVLTELGDSALQGKSDDTYSQVLMDLGGSPSTAAAAAAAKPSSDESASADESFIVSSSTSTEQFMNEALKEAMNEVKVNNPRILSDSGGSDNVLDNKEIMREIEEIFGEGNKKLLASLEEIRMEQV